MFRYLISKEFWFTMLILVVIGLVGFFGFFYVFLPIYTKHDEWAQVPELANLNVDEAEAALKALGLGYEVSDSVYLPGVPKLSVVSHEPPALSKVKPGRKIYLTINKANPPLVKFPEIKNVSNYQAKLTLESWGLGISNIQYEPYEFRHVVIRAELENEELEAGELIPVGTRVVLFVGMGLGHAKLEIPNLLGMTYESSVSQLHALGLNIGSIRHKPEAEETPGTIIRQNPPYIPGDSVNVGSAVDLFISGPEPEEAVEGLQEDEIK